MIDSGRRIGMVVDRSTTCTKLPAVARAAVSGAAGAARIATFEFLAAPARGRPRRRWCRGCALPVA
jgi:hypothetical protein